jgi:DNA-binding SARP family transcriptional activator
MEDWERALDPLEIRRDHLLARLARVHPRIVALIAPAGFGKSTLVRQFLAGRPGATCDCAGVSDDLDLARRLLPALAAENPARERSLTRRELLLGDGGTSVEERLTLALDAWREPAEGICVFENAEHVANCPPAREFFARLLARIPEGRTVIICSRENLRVHLTRFAPPHEVMVLRASDLAFDAGDIRAILAPHVADDVSLDRIRTVSQGWPIAVLLLRRFATEGRIATLLDRLGDVAFDELHDYLIDQVLASLDERLVQAIFACACIPNATLADLRAAFPDARTVADIEAFAQDSPFLVRNDDGTFTVHPLLASLLVDARDERRIELLANVAAQYEAARDFERAAVIHLARGDQHAAAYALGRHEVALDRSPSMAYARVLASLDRVLVQRYPRLWGVTCMLRLFCVSMEELLDEAESVWRMLPPNASPFERFYVFIFRVLLMNYVGLVDDAMAVIDEFVAAVRASGMPAPQLDSWIVYLRALIMARQGRLAEAERGFTTALPVVSSMDVMASGAFVTLGSDIARVRGERALERQFVDHAIELARKSTMMNFVALDLAEATFGAWFAGEEAACTRFAAELAGCVERFSVHGLKYFAAVLGGGTATATIEESVRHVAFGHIVAAASRSDDAEALREARAGLEVARRYSSPFVECIAAIAVALCDDAGFSVAMEEARAAARRCDSAALHDAVDALSAHRRDCGFLAPFAARFSHERRRKVPRLLVEISTGIVRTTGRDVRLSGREQELLFALALRREPTARVRLAAMLWPELDEDGARNALSVCLHRLRRHLGEEAIVRDGEGYRLCDDCKVDLWDMEERIGILRTRSRPRLDDGERAALAAFATALRNERPARTEGWEWFEPVARRLGELRIDVTHRLAADALDRGDPVTALERASEIVASDPFDEPAREVVIRAHLALGDRAAALRHYRQYREMLLAELSCEPSATLTKIVDS